MTRARLPTVDVACATRLDLLLTCCNQCDERLPTCTRCEKRGETCSFLETASNASPGSGHHAGDCCPRQLLELELMHQWATATCESIRSKRHGLDTPAIIMPQEGLTHPYLLDIMFSFTALHIASLKPDQADDYIAAALQYQTKGMQGVAPNLANPSEDNLFSVFWFSALVGMVNVALTVVTRETNGETFTGMLIKLAQLWTGTRTIMDMARSTPTALAKTVRAARAPTPDQSRVELDADIEENFTFLEKIVDSEHADQDANFSVYRESIRISRKALKTWAGERVFDDIMSWAPLLGSEFAASLSSGNPIALLCTMCYGIVLHQIGHVWWMSGAGHAVVDECSTALRDSRAEWRPLIIWARGRVGLPQEIKSEPVGSHAHTPLGNGGI